MKKLIVLLTFMSSLSIAQTISIDKISSKPGFELMFILENKANSQGHISLDCQSFLQKFDFFDQDGQIYSENYISINECEYLYENTLRCLDSSAVKCFDPEDIFNDDCHCSSK